MISRDGRGYRYTATTCPFCSCGCGLHLHGDGGGIVGVLPSCGHPVSGGRLCARGWAAHEAARWGPRLLAPQIRRGGVLQTVSWPDALAEAVQSLASLRQAGRPIGVLGSGRASNEENFLAVTLARSALGTGNVDDGLGACYRALLPGWEDGSPGLAVGSAPSIGLVPSIEALENADLVVVVEGDLAVSHPRLAFGIMRALRRGGRLITLGWRRTQLSELAGLHVPLSASEPQTTLQDLRACVRANRIGGKEPDTAAEGPNDALANAAGWIAESRRAVFLLAPFDADGGTARACASVVTDMADALDATGGATARVMPLPLRANTRGALDVGVVPNRLPGHRLLDDWDARERLWSLWRGQPCWDPGLPAEAMPFSVAGLVVLADDVAAFHDSPATARDALSGLDTLVVLDAFQTATARAAHVVLPIAAFGEYDGTLTSLEGRVQAWRASQPPPDGVRPGWQVLRDLLGLLGAAMLPDSLAEVQDTVGRAVPSYGLQETEGTVAGGGSALPNRTGRHGAVADREMKAHPGRETTAHSGRETHAADGTPGNGRMVLRREAAFDWGADALVSSSPILRREHDAARKGHPAGVVLMNPEEAGALGVREGWKIRLTSAAGQVEVAVSLRAGVEKGVLLVPYVFRDLLAAVSDRGGAVEVEVVRA